MSQPLFIGPYDVGAKRNLKPFMLPEAAFPNLQNALVFRGRVERKNGYTLLGRLQLPARQQGFAAGTYTLTTNSAVPSANVLADANVLANSTQSFAVAFPNARLVPGSISITANGQVFTDPLADGDLVGSLGGVGTINYATGALSALGGATPVVISFNLNMNQPVMGISTRDLKTINQEETIIFDQTYAYRYATGAFTELPSAIPTQWTQDDLHFFWTTNFLQDAAGFDLFWATNNSSTFKAFTVTDFAAAAAGPPSTVQVTSPGNTFKVGDVVTFVGFQTAVSNETTSGVVTVAGNPFTVSNPAAGVFANFAGVSGIAIAADSIRYYRPSTPTWIYTYPLLNIPSAVGPIYPRIVLSCLMLIPYKNRLVLLNTNEIDNPATGSVTNYAQRARWSGNGMATDMKNGWVDTVVGFGGYVDAPTGEQIISCGFVKDSLIVYFERSTWQLLYTGNELLPFVWQRINSELGSDAVKSSTVFDNGLIAMGNVGIHASNGQTTARIDAEIPDEVFQIHNNTTGPDRTCAIRDFVKECIYFSYAGSTTGVVDISTRYFPNTILCYNYRNETFSFFDDNATAFGTFQSLSGTTWADLHQFPWAAWQIPWNSGAFQSGFPDIIFGNQQGYINVIDYDTAANGISRYIDNIIMDTNIANPDGLLITSPNHNLFAPGSGPAAQGDYITIDGCLGVTGVNGLSLQVLYVYSSNTFGTSPIPAAMVGTYKGGGQYKVLGNIGIQTKMFTPYWAQGKRFNLKYVDLLFDKTTSGELKVDIYNDFSDSSSMTDVGNNVLMGAPVVSTVPEFTTSPNYSFQQLGAQIWKRFYASSTGETFQIQLSMNDDEMLSPVINESDVVLHGMILYFDEAGEFF